MGFPKLLLAVTLLALGATAGAQDVKPYKEGQVTDVTYVRTKPGRFDDYMKFLDTDYKKLMDEYKKAGLIVSYAVYSAFPRTPHDPDLILTTTFANMAALDRIGESEAVAARVMGSNDVQNKAAMQREPIREILGGQLVRELILK